jgi:hypothetical protein
MIPNQHQKLVITQPWGLKVNEIEGLGLGLIHKN